MHCVIIAGGSGTRFWPQSRSSHPKQLLELVSGNSLIRHTYDRLSKYKGSEAIYTIASQELTTKIQEQLPQLDDSHSFIEPAARNTAPAIALAALILKKRHGDVVMGVFPADHLIRQEKKFYQALDEAVAKTTSTDCLVTLGIQPTYPATGYGSVQFERQGKGDVHPVVAFTEKPDLQRATDFLEGGSHLWNGGMFVWKVSTFLQQLAQHLPTTYNRLMALESLVDTPEFDLALQQAWPDVDAISVDYGILEHSSSIFTVEARFEWHDLGGWRALYDLLPKDQANNVVRGDVALLDTTNSLVMSNGKFTAVVGADNLIVINTDDATLVLPKDQSERAGEVVGWLKSRKRKELL